MTGNSDGLSPSLKPFLGVGHNRALPAPFGFDNGFFPGANQYFDIPNMVGKSFATGMAIEFWCNGVNDYPDYSGLFHMQDVNGKDLYIQTRPTGELAFELFMPSPNQSSKFDVGMKNHIVFNLDASGSRLISVVNGNYNNRVDTAAPVAFSEALAACRLNIRETGQTGRIPIDEFRIYNRPLTAQEISLNYNARIGNNPCNTENLVAWYNFQQFEMLDFSMLQDNSNILLGIRDLSNRNNHGKPINMETNPASPNYVLKPF